MNPNVSVPTPTRPRPDWLALGQVAWVIVTLVTLGLIVAGVPHRYAQLIELAQADRLTLRQLGFSPAAHATYLIGLDLLVVVAHMVIAFLIVWLCKSHRAAALLVQFALVTNGALIPLARMYALVPLFPLWRVLLEMVIVIGLASGTALLFLFPDGRFVPGWTRWLVGLWALVIFVGTLFPQAPFSFPRWPVAVQLLALVSISGVGVFAQLYRYFNIATAVQQQQTKWALFGLTAAVVGPFAYFLPFVILPALTQQAPPNFMRNLMGQSFFGLSLVFRLVGASVFTLALLVFPLSFAIAILRYRLWDIDLLIRRTLVYSVLSGLLALAYFSTVIVLQLAFRSLTGESSQLAVVVSTLVIAALFFPLRQRVQTFIDRRFYRRKYDAAKALADFAATVRDETDLDQLSARLMEVVRETMQPESVSVWLASTPALEQKSRPGKGAGG